MARFFLVLMLFSLWIALEALFNYLHSRTGSLEPSFVTALGDNYLGVGRVLGIGALITLAYLLFARTLAVKGMCLILFCLFMGVLFLAGGRGPLAAIVLAALVVLVAGWRISASKGLFIKRYVFIFMAVAALIGASVVFLLATDNPTTTLTRFLILFGPDLGSSASQRVDYYEASIPLWTEKPIFGHGIGSWPILMDLGDFRGYPHNIVLEVMVELGLVGLLLLVGMLIFAIRSLGNWRSIQNDPVRILILMLFANTFINACVSGDIPDNRLMFGMLGLMVFTKTVRKKRSYLD